MHTHCYSMLYSCGVFGTVWHWLTRFNMRVPNMPLATCSYCCCPAKGVPWLIVLFSARHCDEIMLQVAWSCFSTGLIAWRWWLLQHGTTTVRKTSQLFKIGKSKKVLPFRVLVQIHEKSATHTHTLCLESGPRVPWVVAQPLISRPISRPSQPSCMPLTVYCASGVRVGLDAIKTTLLGWWEGPRISRFSRWEIRSLLWFASNLVT